MYSSGNAIVDVNIAIIFLVALYGWLVVLPALLAAIVSTVKKRSRNYGLLALGLWALPILLVFLFEGVLQMGRRFSDTAALSLYLVPWISAIVVTILGLLKLRESAE